MTGYECNISWMPHARPSVSFATVLAAIWIGISNSWGRLVKALEIIGEAAYQMRPDARAEAPGIPWNKIIEMRSRLVHAYFDINLDIIWKTVVEGLPPLIEALERILEERQ